MLELVFPDLSFSTRRGKQARVLGGVGVDRAALHFSRLLYG